MSSFEKLAIDLRAAEDAHAATIGTASELTAVRALIVAKLAYFRAYGDHDMVDCLECDLADIDLELRSMKRAA